MIDEASVVADVRRIVAGQIGRDQIDLLPDATLDGLGITSLDIVEIAFAIEERFDIDIPFDAGNAGGTAFGSISSIAQAVTAQLNEKR